MTGRLWGGPLSDLRTTGVKIKTRKDKINWSSRAESCCCLSFGACGARRVVLRPQPVAIPVAVPVAFEWRY